MKYIKMSATEIAEEIQSGKVKAREVIDSIFSHIENNEPEIDSFVTLDKEGATAAADAIDAQIAKGEKPGPLCGVPIAVKDNIVIKGQTTTCASKILDSYKPPYNAHVVDQLKNAGAIIIGKTNLDEFAMGSSTENSGVKVTHNPWDTSRVPGGSSGGSAAAVAAGFSPLALGSDTGGSIRAPASYCGCVGFKPTYGLVSRWGLVAFGSSLDQIGPFSRNVKDAATLTNVIADPDERDSTCSKQAAPDFTQNLDKGVKGMRIGIPHEYFEVDGLSPEVKKSVEDGLAVLESAGAELVKISLPMLEYAIPVYYIIATAEASSNLGRYDGVHYGHRAEGTDNIIDLFSKSRQEGFGPEVKRRIMLGNYVLSAGYYDAYYLRALRVRTKIAEDFQKSFENVDIIASPVCPETAFKIGEKANDPLSMYLSDIYTISVNLAGLPAISIPCGLDASGLPVGMQFIAPCFKDDILFQAAACYESESGKSNLISPVAG